MRSLRFAFLGLLVLPVMFACHTAKGPTAAAKRDYANDMVKESLAELYETNPGTRDRIARAAGYGVISSMESGIFLVSTGNGYGVVVSNATGERTYMRKGGLGAGIGMGLKNIRTVYIFHTPEALNTFIERGMKLGADAGVAAKAKGKGLVAGGQAAVGAGGAGAGIGGEGGGSGAGAVGAGTETYVLTNWGAVARASVIGTKYWKDKNLNE